MKVLNWVTRRFLNVQSCMAVLPDEDMENDYVNSKYDVEETQALLEHGAHLVVDVLEDWKDGILAIGTLAISPLETGCFELVEEVTDNNTDDVRDQNLDNFINNYDNLEENPLMNNVESFSHELEKEVVSDDNKEIMEESVTETVVEIDQENDDIVIKRRVTLADLLSADSDHKLVKKLGDKLPQTQTEVSKDIKTTEKPCVKMIKPTSRSTKGLSKAKKLLKEDLHPMKKFNQLMKRMMKKKIHPDLGGKIQQDMEMQPTSNDTALDPINEEGGSIESSS